MSKEFKIHSTSKFGGWIAKCGLVVTHSHSIVDEYIFDKLKDKYKCKRCAASRS